ncbi:7679_t:CDS:1 [Funneliformis geosporum]|uniref:5304_t:CDS:1 n=1 Tax=Funneliformis geosporum TaxID=1117311 RepID=A0A9W4WMZ8_9GLOM|nr:5304_t:CDS:1 [Funneliformis geosporum]CAI2173592.1 7679_t:CDS:1 [Funneliformis geosporum]
MSKLPLISELNGSSYDEFIRTINVLFESAPPLTNALYSSRPYTSYNSLISLASKFIQNTELPISHKFEIINAHPRLGEDKKNLSLSSLKEQGYFNSSANDSSNKIKSNALDEDEIVNTILQELNNKYEEKFGFRFVIFVNGKSRREIIPILQDTISKGNKDEELERGLSDMMSIATDRLKKLGRE